MAKVNSLGWKSGIVVKILGERIGIRLSDTELDSKLSELVRTQGWVIDESHDPVDLLYSVRLGAKPQRRGQRNFHLLYAQAKRIARSLNESDIWSDLAQSVWEMAGLLSETEVLFKGSFLNQVMILDPSAPNYVSAPREAKPRPHQAIPSALLFVCPEASECRLLTPGESLLELLKRGLSQPAKSLEAYTELVNRCPGYLSGPDWTSQTLNQYLHIRKKVGIDQSKAS